MSFRQANRALDAARVEVSRLHAEREIYEETMKKAFMRGVCALNLEAMHMFREPGDEDGPGGSRDPERVDAGGSSDSGSLTELKIQWRLQILPQFYLSEYKIDSGIIDSKYIRSFPK